MKTEIKIPTNCPSCDSILERVKDQLFCRNLNCSAKSQKQVENYAKVLKIKGLGPRTIEKLGFETIEDIYDTDFDFIKDKIGEKIAIKLDEEIEKATTLNLGTFLAACSIPLIGNTAGSKVALLTNNPLDINKELCKEAGLGDKATKNLVDWIENTYLNMDLPITFTEIQKPKVLNKDITVCITGKTQGYTKNSLTEFLNINGVKVVSSVSSKINYLICDNPKGSAKEKKAIELNIPIITLNNFKEILNK